MTRLRRIAIAYRPIGLCSTAALLAALAALALPCILTAQSLCDLVLEARQQVQKLERDGAEAAAAERAASEEIQKIESLREDAEERAAFENAERAYHAVQEEDRRYTKERDRGRRGPLH